MFCLSSQMKDPTRLFCVCFGSLFIGKRLGVCNSLLGGFLHHGLVVSLCILFLRLCLRHFFIQVLDQKINHADHTGALLCFLRVCIPSCWRRRWSHLIMEPHLCKCRDTGVRNSTWCGSCKLPSHVFVDSVSCRQFSLGWGHIQAWVVKFVQAIFGKR